MEKGDAYSAPKNTVLVRSGWIQFSLGNRFFNEGRRVFYELDFCRIFNSREGYVVNIVPLILRTPHRGFRKEGYFGEL